MFFFSCDKGGKHYSVSQEFKDFFLVQNGSYWIYQDDSTGLKDSTYLKGPPIYQILQTTYNLKDNPSGEGYYIGFQSELMLEYFLYANPSGQNFLSVEFGSSIEAFGMIDQLIPDSNYFINSLPKGYFMVRPMVSSLKVNSVVYNNVLQSRFYNEKNTFNFYFAKYIGFIKLTGTWDNKNQSWSLLRYHVVR
jgi:hypothetical protein